MPQVHKRNSHSKRASNVAVNRAWKRHQAPRSLENRASRRAPKRAAHAANLAMAAATEAAQAPQS